MRSKPKPLPMIGEPDILERLDTWDCSGNPALLTLLQDAADEIEGLWAILDARPNVAVR